MERDDDRKGQYPFLMLSEWLQRALEKSKISQAELARHLTKALGRQIDRAAVNKMAKGSRAIAGDELIEIARFTNEPAPLQDVNLRMVRVAAPVQAGYWAETWEWGDDEQYEVAIPADPSLEGFRLFAAETKGPSMNRRWPEGTVVVFTNVMETEESPIPGKRYVVERRRADGKLEHTVKLLHRDENGAFWLVPESDSPLHQTPVSITDGTGDGDEVRIVGRVRYAVSRE